MTHWLTASISNYYVHCHYAIKAFTGRWLGDESFTGQWLMPLHPGSVCLCTCVNHINKVPKMEHIFLHCLWTACKSPINHCLYGEGRRSDTVVGVWNEGWERWRREPCIRLLFFSAGWPHKPCYPFLFCFSCHLPFGFHLGRQTSFFSLPTFSTLVHWRGLTWISILRVL